MWLPGRLLTPRRMKMCTQRWSAGCCKRNTPVGGWAGNCGRGVHATTRSRRWCGCICATPRRRCGCWWASWYRPWWTRRARRENTSCRAAPTCSTPSRCWWHTSCWPMPGPSCATWIAWLTGRGATTLRLTGEAPWQATPWAWIRNWWLANWDFQRWCRTLSTARLRATAWPSSSMC